MSIFLCSAPDFDSCAHELKKYAASSQVGEEGASLDQESIDLHRQKLLRQLKVVTKRAFALILEQVE